MLMPAQLLQSSQLSEQDPDKSSLFSKPESFLVSKTQTASQRAYKVLLVTGEGHHDYERQKKIISEGVSKLINSQWTIMHHKKAELARNDLSKPGWADPYDVVVYNICHASERNKEFVDSVVATHKKGKPCIVLHCSMHSWNFFIGPRESND